MEVKEKQDRYHNIFSTPQGQIVLHDMLKDLNFFKVTSDENGVALNNYAKHLLYMCGGWTCRLAKEK